jgi:protein ImuA
MQQRDLYPPALAAVGLTPERVLFVHGRNPTTVLLVMEEGLRHAGLAGVVGELSGALSLTASRRLQLAAALVRRAEPGGVSRQPPSISTALSRGVAKSRNALSFSGIIRPAGWTSCTGNGGGS